MTQGLRFGVFVLLFVVARAGIGAELGPKDGQELPATDLERVTVGKAAPDFSLATSSGGVFSLREAASKSNVMLVFYRGVW